MTAFQMLTAGAVTSLYNFQSCVGSCLQVLDVKMVKDKNYYRMVISDGQHYMAAMLASQLQQLVPSGELKPYSIIKLLKSSLNEVKPGQRLLILYELAVQPSPNPLVQIGDPSNIVESAHSEPKVEPYAATGNYAAAAPTGYQQQQPSSYPPQQQQQPSYHPQTGAYKPQMPPSSSYQPQYQPQTSSYQAQTSFVAQPASYGAAAAPAGDAFGYGAAPKYEGASSSSTGYNTKPYGTQQQPSYPSYGTGPVAPTRGATRGNIVNIADLNPYMSNWQIKARVTSKGQMKTWSNAKGEGNLFSFDVLDAAGGEIRITAFKQDADRFFDIIEIGKVYVISFGQLKVANRNFTHLKHEYEITLGRESIVESVQNEDGSIQQMHFEFVPINQLEQHPVNGFVDIIGVISDVSPLQSITSKKTGQEIEKRTITVVDPTNTSIECTIWGANANEYDENMFGANPVVALKGLRVSDFGGRSLSTVSSSTIMLRPDIAEAHNVQRWFDSVGIGAVTSTQSLSKRGGGAGSFEGIPYKQCSEIEQLNSADPAEQSVFLLWATINVLQFNHERPPWYLSCPGADCKKKVTDNGAGGFQCEKCNRSYPTCLPRFIFSFAVSDATGSAWLSVFHEIGVELLQRQAEDLYKANDTGDVSAAETAFRDANFSEYTFKVRTKLDTFNDTSRVRCTVLGLLPVDHAAEASRLSALIAQY